MNNNNGFFEFTEEEEQEANSFAAAFLMPEKLVREVFKEKNGNLEALAKSFKVSLATMKWRLVNLGLWSRK